MAQSADPGGSHQRHPSYWTSKAEIQLLWWDVSRIFSRILVTLMVILVILMGLHGIYRAL